MENNIKKTETKRGRFNIVDVLIVLTVLAVCFAALWIVDPFGWFSPNEISNVNIKYTVEIRGISDDVKNNIKAGDGVFLSSTSNKIGTVASVKIQEAFSWEYVEGNIEMVKRPIAGKSDLFVTSELSCTYEKGIGYMVNGQQITVGMPISIRTESFIGSGYIVAIEEIK